jgi:hypothetical protein
MRVKNETRRSIVSKLLDEIEVIEPFPKGTHYAQKPVSKKWETSLPHCLQDKTKQNKTKQ